MVKSSMLFECGPHSPTSILSLPDVIHMISVPSLCFTALPFPCTVFLQSEAATTIHFAARFVRLLFEGGVYFFGKPGDSWIRYVRVRR